MGISPQIAAMNLRKPDAELAQDPANKKQEDPKMQKRKIDQPQAFKRLAKTK